jgi:hypothetical protein
MRFGVALVVAGQVVSTGCSVDLRVMPLAVSPWFGGMFFINVNQVLVRLWARRGRKSDRMWSVLRDGSSRDRGRCVQRRLLCAERDDPVRDRSWAPTREFGRRLSLTTDGRGLTRVS